MWSNFGILLTPEIFSNAVLSKLHKLITIQSRAGSSTSGKSTTFKQAL